MIHLIEKLKSEIKKAYNVLNNDIREKKAKDEGTRGKVQKRQEQSGVELKEGPVAHVNHSLSSDEQDISASSQAADPVVHNDVIGDNEQESFHVVEGPDMPTKDFSLFRV